MKDPKTYAHSIRKYIIEQEPNEVSLSYIQGRAKDKGHSFKDIMKAMHHVHGFIDIQKRVREGEVYYIKKKEGKKTIKQHDPEWDEYLKRIRKEYEDMVAGRPDPWPNVCSFVWLDNWLVPESQLEHFKKMKYGKNNTGRKGNARRNKLAQ